MTEPMDQARQEAMQLEYELGYSAGHIAGVRAMWEADHEARMPIPAPRRSSPWAWRLFLTWTGFDAAWFAYVIESGHLTRGNALSLGMNIGIFITTCSWKWFTR